MAICVLLYRSVGHTGSRFIGELSCSFTRTCIPNSLINSCARRVTNTDAIASAIVNHTITLYRDQGGTLQTGSEVLIVINSAGDGWSSENVFARCDRDSWEIYETSSFVDRLYRSKESISRDRTNVIPVGNTCDNKSRYAGYRVWRIKSRIGYDGHRIGIRYWNWYRRWMWYRELVKWIDSFYK